MNEFCCSSFQFLHSGESSLGLNIRVTAVNPGYLNFGKLSGNKLRYLITEGYDKPSKNTKILLIEYCPFCGAKLSEFYKSENYINENWQGFFSE